MPKSKIRVRSLYKVRGAIFKVVERASHFGDMGYFIEIIQGKIQNFNSGETVHVIDKWFNNRKISRI